MTNAMKVVLALLSLLLFAHATPLEPNARGVPLLPFEDEKRGRNSHAYLPVNGVPSSQMKEDFIEEISTYAMLANKKWGIPASAMIGMAIIESGYGTTRIAVNANNIFGVKAWGYQPNDAWQLKGQPDEDGGSIPVLADYGVDRKVYDESKRRDNWYRSYGSYKEAVDYLAGTLLLNERYRFAKTNYEQRIRNGWSLEKASKAYLFDIADAGYNHLGGDYYRTRVGSIIDEWNLSQYDTKSFNDVAGHWAEKQIMFIEEMGWISGYADRTYKPNRALTRAQAAAILSSFLALTPTNASISFTDAKQDFWAYIPIQLVAQHRIMNGTGNGRFSPNTFLTRAQMAQIFYNAGFYGYAANNWSNSFIDVDKKFWAYLAVETMKQEGIMAGYSDRRFGPMHATTRAQMAAMIYRLHEKDYSR